MLCVSGRTAFLVRYFFRVLCHLLIMKDHLIQDSISSFSESGIRVTGDGHSTIGLKSYIQSFVADKIKG